MATGPVTQPRLLSGLIGIPLGLPPEGGRAIDLEMTFTGDPAASPVFSSRVRAPVVQYGLSAVRGIIVDTGSVDHIIRLDASTPGGPILCRPASVTWSPVAAPPGDIDLYAEARYETTIKVTLTNFPLPHFWTGYDGGPGLAPWGAVNQSTAVTVDTSTTLLAAANNLRLTLILVNLGPSRVHIMRADGFTGGRLGSIAQYETFDLARLGPEGYIFRGAVYGRTDAGTADVRVTEFDRQVPP